MAVAEADFEEIQNEHDNEINAFQRVVDGLDKDLLKLENELAASLENGIQLQEVVDEQNLFLKEAAETLDESDMKYTALRNQFNIVNNDLIMNSDMENVMFEKESKLVKLTSDNAFNQRRIESLQRKVVKLTMYNDTEKGNSSHAKEIKRLRVLLEQLDRKNEFLLSVVERDTAEKTTLKKMLQTAYSEQEKANVSVSKKENSSQNTADLWGAMNKTPAFVGYDVIFKIDKLVPPPSSAGVGGLGGGTVRRGSVVESLALAKGTSSSSSFSTSAPIDFLTLFQSQQKLDPRMSRAVERLLVGWAVLKLYSKNKKPKSRIVRVDISSKSLFCLPLNVKDDISRSSSSGGASKKGVLLSMINLVVKDFDSEVALQSSQHVEHAACMVCIELTGGERLVLQLPSEQERNDFYDGLSSLLVNYTDGNVYKSRLIKSMNIQQYHSSLYLQSIIAHSNKNNELGEDHFEDITGVLEANVHVEDTSTGGAQTGKGKPPRKIVTRKGSSENGSNGGGSSSMSGLLSAIGSSRRLSAHDNKPGEGNENENDSEDSNNEDPIGSDQSTITQSQPFSHSSEQEKTDAAAAAAALLSTSQDEPPPHPPSTPNPAPVDLSTTYFSPLSKSSSLFSILNKKDKKEKEDIEIHGIGNLYGSEKTEDRRHSINLSNEKGRRKSKFSFVSENPFSQEVIEEENSKSSTESSKKKDSSSSGGADVTRKGPNVRRRSSLFAQHTNPVAEEQVSAFTETDDLPPTRTRGLSVETLARAHQLSLTLSTDQEANNSSPSVVTTATTTTTGNDSAALSANSAATANTTATVPSSATKTPKRMSTPTSPVSVGAANAKRFGMQNNLMRSNSGSVRPNILEPTRRLSRTTLMNVDSESLEMLRQKAQRRKSASQELASQTDLLKKRLAIRRDSVSSGTY